MKTLLAVGSVLVSGLLTVATGIPASASADDGSATAASTWEMPDITGAVLQNAIDEVHAASGNADLPVDAIDYAHGLNVLNLTNWKVCAQSPKAGKEVTPKQKKVTVYVIRLNATKCYG